MRVLTSLSIGGLLAVLTAVPAVAAVPFQLASPPLPAAPGQEFTLCAANIGRKAQMTLQFVNVRTNAIVAEKSLMLFAPGALNPPSDPCLSITAEAIAAAGAQPGAQVNGQLVVVGVVFVKRGFLPKAVTASVQIRAVGSAQAGTMIPLTPVGLSNNAHHH
jgi:hypothetical protein